MIAAMKSAFASRPGQTPASSMVLAPPCRGPLESFKHDTGPRHSITTQHDTSETASALWELCSRTKWLKVGLLFWKVEGQQKPGWTSCNFENPVRDVPCPAVSHQYLVGSVLRSESEAVVVQKTLDARPVCPWLQSRSYLLIRAQLSCEKRSIWTLRTPQWLRIAVANTYIKHTRFQWSLGSQRASHTADCSTQPFSD